MFLGDLIETMSRIPTPRQVQAIAAPALRAEAEFLSSGNVIAGHEACIHWEEVIANRRFATTTVFFRTLTLIRCGLIHFMLHSPEIGEYELRKACACWERALEIAPTRFSQLGTLFSLLGSAYAQTYVLSSSPADLDRAIAVSELAISNTLNNCEALAMNLGQLAELEFRRYGLHHAKSDLDEALAASTKAVALTYGSPLHADFLSLLSVYLGERYSYSGDESDLTGQIAILEELVASKAGDESDAIDRANDLGSALIERYRLSHVATDIERAINLFQVAKVGLPKGSPKWLTVVSNLISGWNSRFEHSGDVIDLQQCLSEAEQAIALCPQEASSHTSLLSALAQGLYNRYKQEGNSQDLERGIQYLTRSVEVTSPDSPKLSLLLHNLGLLHSARHEDNGGLDDVQTAVSLLESSVAHSSPESSDLPGCLSALADSKLMRYNYTGELSDLRAALELGRRALSLTKSTAAEYANVLPALANALVDWYQHEGDLDALGEATSLYREALTKTPAGSKRKGALGDRLAGILLEQYCETKDIRDLDEAISFLGEATAPAGSRLGYACRLNQLGVALLFWYQASGDVTALDKSVISLEDAVNAIPSNSPLVPLCLKNLGEALLNRYRLNANRGDLERCLEMFRKVCSLALDVHPGLVVDVAHIWGNWAADRAIAHETTFEEVAEAHLSGIRAIQLLFRTQLTLEGKKTWLRENDLFPSRAAFALARAGRVQQAVAVLEQCRALMLSDALQRDRADLERLQDQGRGDLVERFRRAAGHLRNLEQQQRSEVITGTYSITVESIRATHTELDNVIADVRGVPGYADFLRPLTFEEIQGAATDRPLAYLTASPWGGLALVVWPDRHRAPTGSLWEGVTPVWLPGLTEESVTNMLAVGRLIRNHDEEFGSGYVGLYGDWHYDHGSARAKNAWVETLDKMTRWLWDVAIGALVEVLHTCGESSLILIPQGLLSFLPFHAAWVEDAVNPSCRRYALDELTLSYVPNARSLIAAKEIARSIPSMTFLGVANPHPSALETLPHSVAEVRSAASYFQDAKILLGDEAVLDRVVEELPRYTVLHFSCHGEADLLQPLNSGLFLSHDAALTLRQLLKMRLQARIAVLSACETGVTDFLLPDEAIGLPAGCVLAGTAGVVHSFWPVDDIIAMMVVARFYELWRNEHHDPAEALRRAQCWVRDSTKQEKVDYAKRCIYAHEDTAGVANTLSCLSENEYSDPIHWAPFSYVGV